MPRSIIEVSPGRDCRCLDQARLLRGRVHARRIRSCRARCAGPRPRSHGWRRRPSARSAWPLVVWRILRGPNRPPDSIAGCRPWRSSIGQRSRRPTSGSSWLARKRASADQWRRSQLIRGAFEATDLRGARRGNTRLHRSRVDWRRVLLGAPRHERSDPTGGPQRIETRATGARAEPGRLNQMYGCGECGRYFE